MTQSGIGLMAPHWRGTTTTGHQVNLTTMEATKVAAALTENWEIGMTYYVH